MKILLFPVGSAGDVYPMVGLGRRLADRGHDVTVITCGYFRDVIDRAGLPLIEMGSAEQFRRVMDDPDLWHPLRGFQIVANWGVLPWFRDQYRLIMQLHEPGNTLLVSSALATGARIAQEKQGIPMASIHLQPAVFWSEFESPKLGGMIPGPRWFKRWQFALAQRLFTDRILCGPINEFRAELGLAPMRRVVERWWHSPQQVIGLFPDWFGPPQPDWIPNVALTGFPLWDSSDVSEPMPELEEFLSAGDPPIVFLPGSAMTQGKRFFSAAVDACKRLGRRAILLTPFTDQLPVDMPPTVRNFSFVPLSRLLPRSAAIVHHGGVGTTAQGLAAGIPHLVMPMSHDQPDNAARVARLGVGRPLKPRAFRPRRVAAILEGLLASNEVKRNCQEKAARLAGVDALGMTCDVLEGMASVQRTKTA